MSIESQAPVSPLRVASLADLVKAGRLVVRGPDRPIALFYDDGVVRAIDNRCPHMGFPLHEGPLQDGILVCPWHHARFDLASGCTFDVWADDAPAYPVEIRGDDVLVYPVVDDNGGERLMKRLRVGMEQNVSLVMAKCTIGLLKEGVPAKDIVREAALFGARNRDGWGSGMVILGAMANIGSILDTEGSAMALTHGISAAARDCAGMAPRRDRYRLGRESLDLSTARRWFRHWTVSRHRDGADRTLMTFLEGGCSAAEATDVIFSAITDRFYADGGHTFDFANKAFEIAERIGWEDASQLLPALVPGTVGARGAEESSPWRSPIDLVALVQENVSRLADASNAGMNKRWAAEVELADTILGDDPHATVDALVQAVADGACPDQLGAALALAAAIRIARFGSANELGDWDTALHTFTYANAVHQALLRCPSIEILRGVFHGAMSCYLDRYLNVPPAHVPAEGELFSDLPQEPLPLLENLLDVCNRQQQAQAATRIVAQYTALGLPSSSLLTTLAQAVLREDAAFHTFQLLEAGLRQFRHWEGTPQARLILIAMARYIAAHAPTQRGFLQTFDIARRLHRGETLYE